MLLGKNYDNAFYFSKVIRENIVDEFVVSFPEAVRDNVLLMTSRLRHHYVVMW